MLSQPNWAGSGQEIPNANEASFVIYFHIIFYGFGSPKIRRKMCEKENKKQIYKERKKIKENKKRDKSDISFLLLFQIDFIYFNSLV